MASDVEICSNALLLLGDSPIASFTEGTLRSRYCANLYPIAKRAILRAHPWNCTIKRVILAPEASTPAFDWGYQFVLPSGFLRLLQVGEAANPIDYSFEGSRILADTNVLPIVYVKEESEAAWDSLLTDVMVKRMEMDLAYPITKSASLRDSLKQEFYARGVGVLARAKSVDGQENIPESWDDSPFLSVRG
jgi:hypothetical protein